MKKLINFKSKIWFITIFLFMALFVSNSCSKSTMYDTPGPGPGPNPKPGTNEVWIQGTAFAPVTMTVVAGTTVKWTNKDGVTHTVTSDDGLFDSGYVSDGGTYTFKFDSMGTFSYHCKIHSSMKAKIVVN